MMKEQENKEADQLRGLRNKRKMIQHQEEKGEEIGKEEEKMMK